jgi:hypothetical protein
VSPAPADIPQPIGACVRLRDSLRNLTGSAAGGVAGQFVPNSGPSAGLDLVAERRAARGGRDGVNGGVLGYAGCLRGAVVAVEAVERLGEVLVPAGPAARAGADRGEGIWGAADRVAEAGVGVGIVVDGLT